MGSGIWWTPFDIPIIYTDPNSIDFDESYTQGPDTVLIARSYFHDSSNGQNRETCPISDPFLSQTSKPNLNSLRQDIETTTDLTQKDNSKQTPEPSTDTETACEPMQQSPSRYNDTPSTLEINDPTTENIPQNDLVILEEADTTYALIQILTTQIHTEFDVCKIFIHAPFRVLILFPNFFAHTSFDFLLFLFVFWGNIITY